MMRSKRLLAAGLVAALGFTAAACGGDDDGDLHTARELSEQSIAWMEEHHVDAHHWGFDCYITAGWCRLSSGDLDGAALLAAKSREVADAIPCIWNQLQAAFLSGGVELTAGQPGDVIRAVEEIRETVGFSTISGYADRLIHLAAEAAIADGRNDLALAYASELSPGPYRQLIRARIDPLSESNLESVLAGRSGWTASARIRADAILATRSHGATPSPELIGLVEQHAATGWVSPFLDLGPRAERALNAIPLDRLHPALHVALGRSAEGRAAVPDVPQLTPREVTLLQLLPTHLSYADMGERMFLSVNTVKSSLKGLYRKLDAHSRAEAVATCQRFGLI